MSKHGILEIDDMGGVISFLEKPSADDTKSRLAVSDSYHKIGWLSSSLTVYGLVNLAIMSFTAFLVDNWQCKKYSVGFCFIHCLPVRHDLW